MQNKMSKIGFSVSLLIVVILLIWIYGFPKKCENPQEITEQELKEVIITSDTDSVIFFNIPKDWNAFYYGDQQLVTDLNNIGGRLSIVSSVSVADRPVTHSDINWEQVDFRLTEGDLLTAEYVSQQENINGQTFEEIELDYFTGYVLNDLNENEPVSKGNSDGLVYFLRPKLDSPNWNLIISKQSKGDNEFEQGVVNILNSLKIQDYNEYINEINS